MPAGRQRSGCCRTLRSCKCFNICKPKPMNAKDFFELSPLGKLRKHGRIPWKLLLAILIVGCSTANVLLLAHTYNPYRRGVQAQLQTMLSPTSSLGVDSISSEGFRKTHFLLTTDAFIASLNKTLSFYSGLASNSSNAYWRYADEVPGISMVVERYVGGSDLFLDNSPDRQVEKTEYLITKGSPPLGPFTNLSKSDMQELVHSLRGILIRYSLVGWDIQPTLRQGYTWEVKAHYDFKHRSRMRFQVYTSNTNHGTESNPQGLKAILIILIFACVISQVLHLRSLLKAVVHFQKLQQRVREFHRYQHMRSPRDEKSDFAISAVSLNIPSSNSRNPLPTVSDVLRFTNKWLLIDFLCNLTNIIVAFSELTAAPGSFTRAGFSIRYDQDVDGEGWWGERMWGLVQSLSPFFAWAKLMEFFDHNSAYYVLFSALETGFPRVVGILLRFLPLFFGYIFLGITLFSGCFDGMSDFDKAAATLFSVANGDSIEDVFDNTKECGTNLSKAYMFSFVVLHICLVLNILLVVVEDSFFDTKAFELDQERQMAKRENETMHLIQWLNKTDQQSSDRSDSSASNSTATTPEQSDVELESSEKAQSKVSSTIIQPHSQREEKGTSLLEKPKEDSGKVDSKEFNSRLAISHRQPSRRRTTIVTKKFSESARSTRPMQPLRRTASQRYCRRKFDSALTPKQSRKVPAGDSKKAGAMQFMRSTTSYKRIFRRRMTGDTKGLPVPASVSVRSGTAVPSSTTDISGKRVGNGKSGLENKNEESSDLSVPFYRRKLRGLIANLSKLLGDFTDDLRMELHKTFAENSSLMKKAQSLADQRDLHTPAKNKLCDRIECLQCSLREVAIRRARKSKRDFIQRIKIIRRRVLVKAMHMEREEKQRRKGIEEQNAKQKKSEEKKSWNS